jgi:hypothetical protein
LVFPKVIADGTRDTLIQISNITNSLIFAECIYVDASFEIPGDPTSPRRWVEHDFPIRLTRQQPTIWRASTGRTVNAFDNPGACVTTGGATTERQSCPGFDPGNIPNVRTFAVGFEGELKCVVTDSSGFPVGANALKGEALIEGPNGTVSEYNALGVQAIDPSGDLTLRLDNIEYNACPAELSFDHFAEGADDPALTALGVAPGTYDMLTELTLIPCTENFESLGFVNGLLDPVTGEPVPVNGPQVTVQVFPVDELEVRLSRSTTIGCYFNEPLATISASAFSVATRGTAMKTVIRPANGNRCRGGTTENLKCSSDDQCEGGGLCLPESGVIGVAESFRVDSGGVRHGSAAIDLHMAGSRVFDEITLNGN